MNINFKKNLCILQFFSVNAKVMYFAKFVVLVICTLSVHVNMNKIAYVPLRFCF